MNFTLKEFFTPPFVKSKGKSDGVEVIMQKSPKRRGGNSKRTRLLNIVRDNIYWLFWDDDGAKTYNQIIDWVAAALNEKYERDNGEPLRWLKQGEWFECPECGDEMALPNRYCKDCGKRLLPPALAHVREKEKDEDRT